MSIEKNALDFQERDRKYNGLPVTDQSSSPMPECKPPKDLEINWYVEKGDNGEWLLSNKNGMQFLRAWDGRTEETAYELRRMALILNGQDPNKDDFTLEEFILMDEEELQFRVDGSDLNLRHMYAQYLFDQQQEKEDV